MSGGGWWVLREWINGFFIFVGITYTSKSNVSGEERNLGFFDPILFVNSLVIYSS